jgi:hypothetical protein
MDELLFLEHKGELKMAKFAPGNSGRRKGSRNKLSGDFIGALADEFAEHGAEAIRIVRVERPHEFLKIEISSSFGINDLRNSACTIARTVGL